MNIYNPKDVKEFGQTLAITLLCVQHLLNPNLAKESWDNPYTKEEAMNILKGMYKMDGMNDDFLKELFKTKNESK